MTLAQLIEDQLKSEIAEAGRTITDPVAFMEWMTETGIGRSAISAVTGVPVDAVLNKMRAATQGPQGVGVDAYERLSQPLTPDNFPGTPSRWDDYRPEGIIIERLSAALEMMRHPHAHWIVDLYVESDGRFPDAAGFAEWTKWLDAGEDPDDVRGWIVQGFSAA